MTKIQIYDTTMRDGTQAEGITLSLQDKLSLAQRLDSLGFDFIEGGFPASNEKDTAFFQKIHDVTLNHTKICAFGMTRRKGKSAKDDSGILALLNAETEYITIVGKSSAFQVEEVIRSSRKENLEMIADTIAFFVENGRKVLYDAEHFFDGWKTDSSYSIQTLQVAVEAGAETITLCDTNGGSMPIEVYEAVRQVLQNVNGRVGIHTHNDCGVAVANAVSAVEAGATHVQGTINGFGERCGNADLIQICAILALKKQGYEVLCPDSISQLTSLSRYVYEMVNVPISKRQPFVGKSAFAHKGGMHVSGINRVSSAYEHIDPVKVGNERRILVSELSGHSNIVAMANRHNINQDERLQQKILEEVVRRENIGYQYEIAEGSFNILVRQVSQTFKPHFEKLHYHVGIESEQDGAMVSEGTVKIRVNGEIRHEVAEGEGPVDALNNAMRKALLPYFPCLKEMRLIDYKVRVINSEAATAAVVRVLIESYDGKDSWGTVGVNENIIEASWQALVDSIEYKLNKDMENR
ncbi:MAG: citramalate synthase [Planctomycetaceae bacterium]|jgi:2-isopropylmalate synthase|nr:citramalate synthase [Planctomycetaceae bacterium]